MYICYRNNIKIILRSTENPWNSVENIFRRLNSLSLLLLRKRVQNTRIKQTVQKHTLTTYEQIVRNNNGNKRILTVKFASIFCHRAIYISDMKRYAMPVCFFSIIHKYINYLSY